MTKLHPEFPFPLRRGPQLRAEPKHAIQTAISIQREVLRSDFRVADQGISLIQQAHDISLKLIRRCDGCLH